MNIIQMRERIMFLIDHVQSPRFPDTAYINSLNISTNTFVNDRYQNIKKRTGYSFEVFERIRDELYTLIEEPGWLTVTSNVLPYSTVQLSDYRHMLLMKVRLNSVTTTEYVAVPTSYDNYKSEITRDPYAIPQNNDLYNQYYLENDSEIQFYPGDGNSVTQCWPAYLVHPAAVSFGTYVNTGNFTPTSAQINIIVSEDYTTIAGTSYRIGDEVTLTAGVLVAVVGQIVHSYTNCNLPILAHEEICKLASELLMGVVDDYNKSKFLEEQEKKS